MGGAISDDDFEQAERLLDQAFAEAEPDARLRAEIVIPRMQIVLPATWAGSGRSVWPESARRRGGRRRSPSCSLAF